MAKPRDDGKHGADRIPVAALAEVETLVGAGRKTAAGTLLSSLARRHKLKSYEVEHLVACIQQKVTKGK